MVRRFVSKQFITVLLVAVLPALVLAGNGNGRGKGKNRSAPGPAPAVEFDSTVIGAGGYPNAVALDAQGRPCTAYFKGTELMFAIREGTGWNIQGTGIRAGDYGATTVDLAVNGFGQPGVAYSVSRVSGVTVNWVRFATLDGGTWTDHLVDNGFSPSVAVDRLGEWVLAYSKTEASGLTLKVAEHSPAGWQISTVTDSLGGDARIYGPSMAVDGFGNIGISYGYRIPGVTHQTRMAYRNGGVWTFTTLHSAFAVATDLAFDGANRPHVGFYVGGGDLRVVSADGAGGWSNHVLPWQGSGTPGQLSIDVDAAGTMFLSAYDSGSQDLHLISGTAGSFTDQMLASSGEVGVSNSLQVDQATGGKCATYYDQTNHLLRFMSF